MKILLAAFLLILCTAAMSRTRQMAEYTQTSLASSAIDTINPQLTPANGEVQIVVDSSITKLEKSMRGFKDIKGYRVQIFLGTAEAVKSERNKYLSMGMPYSAYMKQVIPEYALVIGDFSTRMELEKHLQFIQQHYPKAFAVSDMIEIKAKK